LSVYLDEATTSPAGAGARLASDSLMKKFERTILALSRAALNTSTLPISVHGVQQQRLRPAIDGAEAVDSALGATAAAEGHRHFAERVAATRHRLHPVDEFGFECANPISEKVDRLSDLDVTKIRITCPFSCIDKKVRNQKPHNLRFYWNVLRRR
jgi:hypothetical protein